MPCRWPPPPEGCAPWFSWCICKICWGAWAPTEVRGLFYGCVRKPGVATAPNINVFECVNGVVVVPDHVPGLYVCDFCAFLGMVVGSGVGGDGFSGPCHLLITVSLSPPVSVSMVPFDLLAAPGSSFVSIGVLAVFLIAAVGSLASSVLHC